ncbi:MAG: hypothetical protein QM504_15925 [Pseudomonadota bacterium]
MKKVGIILLVTTAMLFSTSANSFYNSDNMPMIKMMSLMMEMMGRMMMGGGSNNFSSFPLSPSMGAPAMGGFPMSPINPMSSLYGSNIASNAANPWLNRSSNTFTQQNPNLVQSSVFAQTSPFNNAKKDDSMNGIWQALSGDVIAIYYNSNFIWTNGKDKHLAGSLIIKGSQLSAYIATKNKVINFQFYRENNKFAVKDGTGQIHIFTRIH